MDTAQYAIDFVAIHHSQPMLNRQFKVCVAQTVASSVAHLIECFEHINRPSKHGKQHPHLLTNTQGHST
jgi:hypothetical protein